MDPSQTMELSEHAPEMHALSDKWVLWAHLPHDTDWSLKSYRHIMCIGSVEGMVALYSAIPETLVRNCMLFLMRNKINPTWEDPKNRSGGCFSFKVPNKSVPSVWQRLSYVLVGETLTPDSNLGKRINGITISPKKAFCIIKVWLRDCTMQDPTRLRELSGLNIHGCIFKRHKPEF